MNIIKITITSKQELAKIYIQHFKFGGVFVKGEYDYQLGDEIFIIITPPHEEGIAEANIENLAITGKVAWISQHSVVGYPIGIGIHFNPDKAGTAAKATLEIMLAGALTDNGLRYTF